MLPEVIIPNDIGDPSQRSTWAFYGLTQLLDLIGLSYRVVDDIDDCQSPLIISPAAGQICVKCRPTETKAERIVPALRVQFKASFSPDPLGIAPSVADLPVFGGMRNLHGEQTGGLLTMVNGKYELSGPLYIYEAIGEEGFRFTFNAPVFETVGLYLSRFSWNENPGFHRFVRYVDALWEAVAENWGQCAVVNEYQEFLTALLQYCFQRLDLVMVTRWLHPCIDNQVRLSAMSISHDVDSVYNRASLRGNADQQGNTHWNIERWRKLEEHFGIKSAFYFFSPSPEDSYWLENPAYLVTDPPLLSLVRDLAADGWEIAPHCLGYRTASELSNEVAYFTQVTGVVPSGTRNHYLTHSPDALKFKAAAGLKYDSTWYAEQTTSTLLTGTVFPYAPLNTNTGSTVELWEFGFVIEDGIVTGCYGVDTERDTAGGIADGAAILDVVFAKNGYACFNWHQRTFALRTSRQEKEESWVGMLEGLIEYFQKNAPNPWYPLLGEVAHFWSLRQSIEVESCSDTISVKNCGQEDFSECVIVFHCDPHSVPGDALYLPERGICCLPVPLEAGECKTLSVQ